MQSTFDALAPVQDTNTVDPSVTPDVGNNLDLAAIVQRLDDLTEQVAQLSAAVAKQDAPTEQDTDTETMTETKTETAEKEESEDN